MRGQEEFRLCCVIADYLARALPPRAQWSHLPFGENRSEVTGARLKRMGSKRGWPDYLIFIDGKAMAIEVKTAKGKLSDEQAAFADAFTGNGFLWGVARSLDDVERLLWGWGVPLRCSALKTALAGSVAA